MYFIGKMRHDAAHLVIRCTKLNGCVYKEQMAHLLDSFRYEFGAAAYWKKSHCCFGVVTGMKSVGFWRCYRVGNGLKTGVLAFSLLNNSFCSKISKLFFIVRKASSTTRNLNSKLHTFL